MGLNHAQRMNVMFEYLKREIDGNIDKFALLCGISSKTVYGSLTRQHNNLSMLTRFNICKNLYLSPYVWSDTFENEEDMLKELSKYNNSNII